MADLVRFIPGDILHNFEVHNYNHAAEILSQAFASDFDELIGALRHLKITVDEIKRSGGNESPIPPKFSEVLDPLGWKEIRISGDLIIHFYPRRGNTRGRFEAHPSNSMALNNYIDGHNIDFLKGRIACDIEWNSKDQTYDRDLFAFRTYYECGIISVAVLITRSESLNEIFRSIGVMQKYGASTTWMGKLLPRLDSRRHGGCPILAVGITPHSVTDFGDEEDDAHST
ncbi:MAG TPA: restriction endonuclease [Ruminococcaceae bacterium]|nr:restriction endonuclease [Oscillospiraceae bacterium]